MALRTMHDLFLEELRELLDAEKQAVRAYPKLMKAIASERFKEVIEEHTEQTKGQIERLNQIFEDLDTRSRGKPCEALRGLVEDAQDLLDKNMSPELQDVALVAAAQKMEHFEIAAYGSARAHAEALELENAVKLLDETLEEEKEADKKLNEVAINDVNKRAVEGAEEGEEEEDADEEEGEERRGKARSQREAAGDKPRSRSKE